MIVTIFSVLIDEERRTSFVYSLFSLIMLGFWPMFVSFVVAIASFQAMGYPTMFVEDESAPMPDSNRRNIRICFGLSLIAIIAYYYYFFWMLP